MKPEEEKKFVVKTYNSKELAGQYDVSPKTFRRWLKRANVDVGVRLGNYFTPQQVRTIVEKIGLPFAWLAGFLTRTFFGVDTDTHDDVTGQNNTGLK